MQGELRVNQATLHLGRQEKETASDFGTFPSPSVLCAGYVDVYNIDVFYWFLQQTDSFSILQLCWTSVQVVLCHASVDCDTAVSIIVVPWVCVGLAKNQLRGIALALASPDLASPHHLFEGGVASPSKINVPA